MRLLDRYVLRQWLPAFFWCIITFLFLYILIDLLAHLDEILKNRIAFQILFDYYVGSVPVIFVQIVPFATLLASIYSLSNLSKNNELIAMRASGISTFKILFPLLCTGLLISSLIFTLNEKIIPTALKTSKTIEEQHIEKKKKIKGHKVLEDLAAYGNENRIFYAKILDLNKNVMKEPIILEQREDLTVKRKIIASYAEWLGFKWRFYECSIYRFDRDGQMIGPVLYFDHKILNITESPEQLIRFEQQTDFMSAKQLKEYINRLDIIGEKSTRRLLVDYFYKFSFPIANFVVILIGVPFAMRTSRAGTLAGMALSIGIAFIFYGTNAISLAMGKAGFLPPSISAWLANGMFSIIGLILLGKGVR